MANIVNIRVDKFLGLNNVLNPASAEYKEGMAYRAKNCRLDRTGVWTARPVLSDAGDTEPGHLTAWGSGNHFKNMAVENTDKIIDGIATTESIEVGSNGILYGTTGSGTVARQLASGEASKSTIAAPTAPTVDTAPETYGDGTSRAENGIYYYIFTSYNDTYKHESVPTIAYKVELTDCENENILLKATANDDGDEIRLYRSRRTSSDAGVYNPTNIFYYVDTLTSDTDFYDQLHDNEIINFEYEGRGSVPPDDIDYIISFNDRMLYFKGNTLYWSSSGKPQEVAQEYTIAMATEEGLDPATVDVQCKPKLSLGSYGEAKYEISELAGKTVTACLRRNEKVWVFTANTVGHLVATNKLEGYKYKEYRRGIGCVNDKCLVSTPFGIFGADRQGMWIIDNFGSLNRITDGRIDLLGGTDTTITQSYVTDSFLLWVPVLNEVWWSMQYSDTPSYIQIVYQADRKIFTGPYTHTITGGCNYETTSGMFTYVTNDKYVNTSTADTTQAQYLDFWFGQSNPVAIKDQLEVQPVHSATPGASVNAKIYQSNIASTSGITAEDYDYSVEIKNLEAHSQGKLFKLELTLPSAGAALAAINYRYNIAGWVWSDRFKR